MKTFFTTLFLVCCAWQLCAQMTPADYIAKYKDLAISEMRRMGVPAAITLAQGLLESEDGNSELATKANNHFGIKCKSTWTEATFRHDDDAPGECFRVYKSAEDSYRDHSDFLRGSDRYAFLFRLDPMDYRGWAYGLSRAGYATNPHYPEILIKNIEDNNLQQYTLAALGSGGDSTGYAAGETPSGAGTSELPDSAEQPFNVPLTINGSRALRVAKGTSLLVVATQNNIHLSRLLEFNDLEHDGILDKDQYIYLERKQKEGDQDDYRVRGDESLYDVSQINGVILQDLYAYNPDIRTPDHLAPGTRILLRPPAAEPDTDARPSVASREKAPVMIHTVHPRESLYSISRQYGVTIDQLKYWNKLDTNNLKTGQRLIVSK